MSNYVITTVVIDILLVVGLIFSIFAEEQLKAKYGQRTLNFLRRAATLAIIFSAVVVIASILGPVDTWALSISQGLLYSGVALGVYLTFRLLDFPDLTVNGSLPLGGAVASTLMVFHQWNPWAALAVATLAGAAAGALTALVSTTFKLNGLLVSIIVLFGLYTVNLRTQNGDADLTFNVGNPPPLITDTFAQLGWSQRVIDFLHLFGMNAHRSDFADYYLEIISYGAILLVVLFLLNWFLHTEVGLALRATGANEQMIRANGVNTSLYKILGLALSNGLVALSGVLVLTYTRASFVSSGADAIIIGLASVILGETLFSPRSVVGTTLAIVMGTQLYFFVITAAVNIPGFTVPVTGWNVTFIGGDRQLVIAVLVIATLVVPRLGKYSYFGNRFKKVKEPIVQHGQV